MTTTTLEVEELLPEQTPDPIRIASRSTVNGEILDMGAGSGWTCNVRLEHPYGTIIGSQTPITELVSVDGLNRFNVKIPIAWADLLTGLEETYWLIVRTRNDDLQQRDVHIKPLKVTLNPTVADSSDAGLLQAVSAAGEATGPKELPEPTSASGLKAFALIGDGWQDQLHLPGRSDPDRSLWRFHWLPRQVNEMRNAMNALIAWACTAGALTSVVENAFSAFRESDASLTNATVNDWVESLDPNTIYERDFGDGFATSFNMIHTAGDVVDATVVNNLTNRPIGISIDWLTTPGQIIVGPFATAPAVDQMHLIVEGKKP